MSGPLRPIMESSGWNAGSGCPSGKTPHPDHKSAQRQLVSLKKKSNTQNMHVWHSVAIAEMFGHVARMATAQQQNSKANAKRFQPATKETFMSKMSGGKPSGGASGKPFPAPKASAPKAGPKAGGANGGSVRQKGGMGKGRRLQGSGDLIFATPEP